MGRCDALRSPAVTEATLCHVAKWGRRGPETRTASPESHTVGQGRQGGPAGARGPGAVWRRPEAVPESEARPWPRARAPPLRLLGVRHVEAFGRIPGATFPPGQSLPGPLGVPHPPPHTTHPRPTRALWEQTASRTHARTHAPCAPGGPQGRSVRVAGRTQGVCSSHRALLAQGAGLPPAFHACKSQKALQGSVGSNVLCAVVCVLRVVGDMGEDKCPSMPSPSSV